ncbi:hypothetical protein BGX23_008185 [Mortierella sp. AD031]|nr:hypothetical protein BGX23_008185 [Mortierella sp. AD031]
MLSIKNFRPLVFVAAVAFMLLASTSVQAAPATPATGVLAMLSAEEIKSHLLKSRIQRLELDIL